MDAIQCNGSLAPWINRRRRSTSAYGTDYHYLLLSSMPSFSASLLFPVGGNVLPCSLLFTTSQYLPLATFLFAASKNSSSRSKASLCSWERLRSGEARCREEMLCSWRSSRAFSFASPLLRGLCARDATFLCLLGARGLSHTHKSCDGGSGVGLGRWLQVIFSFLTTCPRSSSPEPAREGVRSQCSRRGRTESPATSEMYSAVASDSEELLAGGVSHSFLCALANGVILINCEELSEVHTPPGDWKLSRSTFLSMNCYHHGL